MTWIGAAMVNTCHNFLNIRRCDIWNTIAAIRARMYIENHGVPRQSLSQVPCCRVCRVWNVESKIGFELAR
jgi:hypothetical protein